MKTTVIKNNFSAGELSPVLSTRTDIQQYANGAKELTNMIPLVEGGVRKRPGTYFRQIMAGALRLIPFVVKSESSYLLIFKPLQLIVYNPRTYAVVATLTTPYTADQIPDVQFVQYRYDMFFTHSKVPVQRFRSSTNFTNWEIAEFIFTHPPLNDDAARYPFRKATPSDKTIGTNITVTLSDVAAWDSATSYIKGDVVTYAASYWQALVANTNQAPALNSTYWAKVTSTVVDTFLATDVGSYISINGGIVKVTKWNSASQVGGEIVKAFDSVNAAVERSWGITPPAFNATNGYPRCVTFFKQRLALANILAAPNKIWLSAVGENGNFLETTDDADAFSIVSASGLSNSILFIEATRGVICLTSGGEYMVSSNGALTPTTAEINEHTAYGAYPITRPCRVGNELLFVQRGGERLRALSYRYEVDGLVSPEISTLASHIGEEHGGIEEITYQQEPESIVWCKMGDGKVASITFNRDQEVIAWAQHDFGGSTLSMCSLPTKLGSDQCFMLINRNGSICLEEVSFNANMDSQRDAAIVNNAIDVSPITYIDSFDLMKQEDSEIYYAVAFTKSGTTLKISNTDQSGTVQLGKPFDCKMQLFPPELSQSPASTMIYKAQISRMAFFFYKTLAPVFNGKQLELLKFSNDPLSKRKLFTGRYLHEGGNFSDLYDVPLVITHNKPLPFRLQAVAMEISINER